MKYSPGYLATARVEFLLSGNLTRTVDDPTSIYVLCFNFSIQSQKRKMSFVFASLFEVMVAGTNIADESFCFKVDKT